MDNKIEVFSNDQFGDLRVTDRNGDPWFLAVDICRPIEVRTDTLKSTLDKDEVCETDPITIGVSAPTKKVLLISLPGVFSLLNKSRKPQAKPFRRWVNHEVLPAIFRHGEYIPARPREVTVTADALIALADRLRLAEDRVDVLKPTSPYGSISEYNGRERIRLIRAYFRTLERDMLRGINDGQGRLFDFS